MISSNQHCVTIEVETGLLFDGALNHAGARVNYTGYLESLILQDVQLAVKSTGGGAKSALDFEKIFNKLCSIKGMSSICRLHVALFPTGVALSQNQNSVGRDGCPEIPEFY